MTRTIDWSYHRKGCKTCEKAQEFLNEHHISPGEQIIANKVALAEERARELLAAADELIATKGTKVIQVNLKKDPPTDLELMKLMIGPSGKLRAPTLKVGRKLIVGFDESAYKQIFG